MSDNAIDVTEAINENYPFVVSIPRGSSPLVNVDWLTKHVGPPPKFNLFHLYERHLSPVALDTTPFWQISIALSSSPSEVQHKVFFKNEHDAILFKVARG